MQKFAKKTADWNNFLSAAIAAFRAADFKDVAYFEPFYLKETSTL
jgi:hypothetical protein